MNNERRKAISVIVDLLEGVQSDIEDLAGEEQDSFDNMPEGIQMSERGDRAEEAIQNLNEAKDAVLEAMSLLGEASA